MATSELGAVRSWRPNGAYLRFVASEILWSVWATAINTGGWVCLGLFASQALVASNSVDSGVR
jgi:hypothetical protein